MTIRYATDASETAVQSAINACTFGDTVHVPAAIDGSYTWSGLTLAEGINLVGAGSYANGGGIETHVTIAHHAGWTITKSANRFMLIKGFVFHGLGSDADPYPRPINVYGSWLSAEPVIFYDCDFYYGDTADGFGGPIMDVRVPGGVILSNTFWHPWGNPNDFGWTIQDQTSEASWLAADSMGDRDTTGKMNVYFEDSIVYRDANIPAYQAPPTYYTSGGTRGNFDMSDCARMVCRYNNFYNSGAVQSHGRDSGVYGTRHFEIYENDFHYDASGQNNVINGCNNYESLTSNCAQGVIWIRAGTGVIHNNRIPSLNSGCWGSKKAILFSVRAAEDDVIQGPPYDCSSVSYPIPAQIGQNWDGAAWFTDPIWMWGNTGAGLPPTPHSVYDIFNDWGNICGWPDWPNGFFLRDRDYVISGDDGSGSTAKPGYAVYPHPHPLIATALASIDDGGGGTSIVLAGQRWV